MKQTVADLRVNYSRSTLEIDDVDINPIIQFEKWFQQAINAEVKEPNAMVLSTCGKDGMPESRVVLLKGFEQRGFTFFTNYKSDKSRQLLENENCSLLFVWLDLERQVRIKGRASKLSEKDSEIYFHSRPRESQIGAWTSPQSVEIPDRNYLEGLFEEKKLKFRDTDIIPLPDFWGGYLIEPIEIEFWQGRENRLHDRLSYKHEGENWKIVRLAP